MGGLLHDYSGLTFNYLTAIKFEYRKNNKTFWLFECICKNKCVREIQKTKKGISKSCGCKNLRGVKKGETIEHNFNNLFHRYKTSSITRNIEFLLTKEQFRTVTSLNCHYCGVLPIQSVSVIRNKSIYLYNGIDRVDNNIGYTYDNCKPCCFVCNRAKRDMIYNDFIEYIKRLKSFEIIID